MNNSEIYLRKFKLNLKNYFILTRFTLSLTIAFSAFSGYILCKHYFDLNSFYVFFGVFFFSSLASVINSYQEKDIDKLMERTRFRFHSLQQIRKHELIFFSLLVFLLGSLLLIRTGHILTLILAIFNLVWYNLVYTPLKKRTAYALIIGAVTGAIPPMIGWTAAGGKIFDIQIIVIALFMFLWQIPHFWLLLIRNSIDYKKTGLKIAHILQKENIRLIMFLWMLSTAACSSMFPIFNIVKNNLLIVFLMIINSFILYFFYKKLFNKNMVQKDNRYIYPLYLYQAITMIILIIDSLGIKQFIK